MSVWKQKNSSNLQFTYYTNFIYFKSLPQSKIRKDVNA